uniref:putative F-box/FBD/LRR-repeat protein At1g78760 n=1 Tax=Fragaria vesca subsp. vesca TaxID=101020 RepID=UPI0005C927F3|nr:PREDICTED: putative F-box/FBD/LRR-repeat protein At1g78760 [Fragaria vesca subsp. vesca]
MASEAIRHDRISQLPDVVLSHILCFLPTRDAIQTTILCKRWNKLWISIPNLDLDYNVISRHVFEKFVDGVLSLHASSNIQKFRLCSEGNCYNNCGDEHLTRTSGWICKAMKHNIVELDLGIYDTRFKDLELPDSFFTCKTLVALKVSSNCINLAPPPSASTCFPSLKSLHYSLYRPDSASVFDLLVSKCPVLEDLTIDAEIFAEDVYTLDIPAAGLKTFRFLGTSFLVGRKYSFSFNSPKLENLVVSDRAGLANYYFSNNAKAMVKAVIHSIHGYKDDNINHVVRAPPFT